MKLRIKGDTLRLRLTRGEVERLATSGELEEKMHLAGGVFSYAVRSGSENEICAQLLDTRLTVVLPDSLIQSWAQSEQVSLLGQDGPLKILVEKDFACLQPREGEDDADAFPHPNQPAYD